ncbi:MAG: PLP-dependent aminotransferase family protein, partial [Clostridiales bacterium]|nr:PLP-dependent aminotransferase family protein [Clostridiales bacterium]
MKTDSASFDFNKWEACMQEVLNETPNLLLTESDRQGEPVLRAEIADYLHRTRGVVCSQK